MGVRCVFQSEFESEVQSTRSRLEAAGIEVIVGIEDSEVELLDICWEAAHVARTSWPTRTYLLQVPEAQAEAALAFLGTSSGAE